MITPPDGSKAETTLLPKLRPVLVVTRVPPTRAGISRDGELVRHPSGFSSRLFHFLEALSEVRPIDIIALEPDDRLLSEPFYDHDLPVRRFESIPAGVPPTSQSGARGRFFRWRHYLFSRSPAWAYPPALPELESAFSKNPALVVIYLSELAHLTLQVPDSIPVVSVLEQGWERIESVALLNLQIARWKRKWIDSTERVRACSLYRKVSMRASALVAISEEERDWFAQCVPRELVKVIPHGVDCKYFSPAHGAIEEHDVAVFGLFQSRRNEKASRAVWEAAQSEQLSNEWKWLFGGAGSEIFQAPGHANTTVTGLVPDLRPFYSSARVVIVPAVWGSGVKTTVLQAWAMGKPVVATTFALKGTPAVADQNVLIANSPQEFLSQIGRLLDSPALRRQIGENGRATVVTTRNLVKLRQEFVNICVEAIH